jgi:glycosyltransferase involved in cell wall biosynthesis
MPQPPREFGNLRVAILTEMGEWSASTRHRALQHVPRLRSIVGHVDVSMAGDAVSRHPGRSGQIRYFATHAGRYVRRGVEVRRLLAGHHALLVQRGLYPLGPGTIVEALHGYGGRVVFDLDDALFTPSPLLSRKGPAARWVYGPQRALKLLARADEVVASTAELAEMLPLRDAPVTVLPTVPDPASYQLVDQQEGLPVVVGWAGNAGGLQYLDPLAAVFERLAREDVARLEVVSSAPWPGRAVFRPWALNEETSLFSDFAVGIMPLPDTPYTRAKAGFKLLQYMAAGLPVVASPVGVNVELVRRSEAGFLAAGATEWEEALRQLAGDPQLRHQMGRRGRNFVERYADLKFHARTLARLLAGAGIDRSRPNL